MYSCFVEDKMKRLYIIVILLACIIALVANHFDQKVIGAVAITFIAGCALWRERSGK